MRLDEHVATILSWWNDRSLAEVSRELEGMAEDHPLLRSAEALAAAADDADPDRCRAGIAALFGGVVEPLNDRLVPAGRAIYARIFARVIWSCVQRDDRLRQALSRLGIESEAALRHRHARLRQADGPPPGARPGAVLVLSRVTVGADVLLTSAVLAAVHQAHPQARLILAGDPKLSGVFGGLPGLVIEPVRYGRRGRLSDRLGVWLDLLDLVRRVEADWVVSPDSRLDQLGLLPLTRDPAAHLLWENVRDPSLPVLPLRQQVADWCARRLGVRPADRPRIWLDAQADRLARIFAAALGATPTCAVKFDTGGVAAHALPAVAELAILGRLRSLGWRILLDRGWGEAELAASDQLQARLGWPSLDLSGADGCLGRPIETLAPGELAETGLIRFHGPIAAWAAALAACRAAFSYQSVHQHLAGALGIPVVVASVQPPTPWFDQAWAPAGPEWAQLLPIQRPDLEWPGILDHLPSL